MTEQKNKDQAERPDKTRMGPLRSMPEKEGTTSAGETISNTNRAEMLLRLKRFRPMDDTFLRPLFRDNLPLAQFVLRIVTGIDDLVLTRAETQRDLKRADGGRALCLDVYGVDSRGTLYNLEIQRTKDGAIPKRARYHASAMDVDHLDAGQGFGELPESYTIFITEADMFGLGKGRYSVERVNIDTDEFFLDQEHILYINGTYRGRDNLGKLMHDFNCSDPDDMYFPIMSERTRYLKEKKEGTDYMCQIMDEWQAEIEARIRKEMAEKVEEARREVEKTRRNAEEKVRREVAETQKNAEEKAENTMRDMIQNIMDSIGCSAQKAMILLKIPTADQPKYAAMLDIS